MSKITIQNIPYITSEDAETLVGVHFSKFEFTQMAENGSYHLLGTDDAAVEHIKPMSCRDHNKFLFVFLIRYRCSQPSNTPWGSSRTPRKTHGKRCASSENRSPVRNR